ncbi:hypothetical protein WMY93_029796 [Mugilogobius chulae]|uniref:Uncharacterized protein n=1 Tax=Mugilogobius chulae TaxID=88201 RepID=A0AAW0MKV6_9GOBI
MCPVRGCFIRVGHIRRHILAHKDISSNEKEIYLAKARRQTALKALSELRATNPEPPLVSPKRPPLSLKEFKSWKIQYSIYIPCSTSGGEDSDEEKEPPQQFSPEEPQSAQEGETQSQSAQEGETQSQSAQEGETQSQSAQEEETQSQSAQKEETQSQSAQKEETQSQSAQEEETQSAKHKKAKKEKAKKDKVKEEIRPKRQKAPTRLHGCAQISHRTKDSDEEPQKSPQQIPETSDFENETKETNPEEEKEEILKNIHEIYEAYKAEKRGEELRFPPTVHPAITKLIKDRRKGSTEQFQFSKPLSTQLSSAVLAYCQRQ